MFIETGTFRGDTINGLKDTFSQLYSIELDESLYHDAKKRLEKEKNVIILHGDSGKILHKILDPIDEHIFFWLDGHYDGKGSNTAKGELITPIINELKTIYDHSNKTNKKHIILIDDAKCFDGKNDYPRIDDLYKLIEKYFPAHKIINQHDIIQIVY